MDEKTAVCPKCKETVMATADICKHCRYDLLSYRKKNEQVALKKAIKEEFSIRIKDARNKHIIVYSLVLIPIVGYLLTALVILPAIMDKQNEDRLIAGAFVALRMSDYMDIELSKDVTSDPVFQYVSKYVDEGYFPSFSSFYSFLCVIPGMMVYNTYKPLIKIHKNEKSVIEKILGYDYDNAESAIKAENVILELDKARANWRSGYRDAAYQRIGSAISCMASNKKRYWEQIETKTGYRQISNTFFEYYKHKYLKSLPSIKDSTSNLLAYFSEILDNDLKNKADNGPDWRHYLFPSYRGFNFESVKDYPVLTTLDVWIRAGIGIALSLLFWPIALIFAFLGAKRNVIQERKRVV